MRLLGIDYGVKRIGLAITDPMQIISSPLDTIKIEKIFIFLNDFFKREKIEKIIIGWPINLKGQENEMTNEVNIFINKLKSITKTPIIKVDERFTSSLAQSSLIYFNSKKKQREDKSNVDKISACLILQSYLNRKR